MLPIELCFEQYIPLEHTGQSSEPMTFLEPTPEMEALVGTCVPAGGEAHVSVTPAPPPWDGATDLPGSG